MYAFEIPNLRYSLPAGAAIERYRFVAVNSASAGVLPSAGGAAIGVSRNKTAIGEVLEIADGLVIVEAAETIAAGDVVESDAAGKAVVRTTGIALGMAITGGAAGQVVTVKAPVVSGIDGAAADKQVILYNVAELAAGADLAATPIFAIPTGYTGKIISATLISKGTAAGVDDANTSVFSLGVGATAIAAKTFNTAVAFPASGAATALTVTAENAEQDADSVLALTITNGATADVPTCVLQLVVSLAKN